MKEDKKLLYFISPNKDNNFYEQLERVDDLFQRERHHVFNSDFKVFKAKEIYDFVRRLDPITGNKTISKCLILDNSNQFDSKVLICPIYPKSASENKFGLNIGKIYQISDSEEYIAALAEIRYVNKKRFVSDPKTKAETNFYGVLNASSYLSILNSYKKIVQTIIDKSTEYNSNLFAQRRYLTA